MPRPVQHSSCRSVGHFENRTAETFVRFFSFLARFFPSITTFMCDRHHAQRKAIAQVFGETDHIFHCCVHVARNIANNTGQNSVLARRFWAMRYSRTRESETKFLEALNKVHALKRSLFTTHLLHSVDSFLPSKIDPFLKQKMIPELETFRDIDLTNLVRRGHVTNRVVEMISVLLSVQVEPDIFTVDNTNTAEGYFSSSRRDSHFRRRHWSICSTPSLIPKKLHSQNKPITTNIPGKVDLWSLFHRLSGSATRHVN